MSINFINDSYLMDSDSGSYLDGLSACTFMSWVKSDSINTDDGWQIAINPDSGDSHIGFRFDTVGAVSGNDDCLKAGLSVSGNDHSRETAANTQTTDWLHTCCRWSNGNIMQIYLNGVEDTTATGITGTGVGTFSTGHQPFNVGRGTKYVTTADGWNGLLADLRIYNRSLSVNEIETIYALRGSDRIVNGLLVRYAFMEGAPGVSIGTTTDLIKDWGNEANRHLTRTGAASPAWEGSGILRLGGRRR